MVFLLAQALVPDLPNRFLRSPVPVQSPPAVSEQPADRKRQIAHQQHQAQAALPIFRVMQYLVRVPQD
jgi:hypothetical protein